MTRAEVVKREREQDLLDALALQQITKSQFVKLHSELCDDWHDAMCAVRLFEEAEKSS